MSTEGATDNPDVCVIGAGPSGLATARALLQEGIPFEVLERHHDVGGIWDLARADTPMYDSAHFISSRTQSAFTGFPMPDRYPDYPSNAQILMYLRAFADHYRLRPHIRFGTSVRAVRQVDGAWEVTTDDGVTRRYAAVVLAVGHNWDPVLPAYPGAFTGRISHAAAYRSPRELEGKRVLVVGAGNSGCDIACDAARVAERAVLSLRRGYHFLPKHVFGQPTDAFFRTGPHLPMWIAQPALTFLLRILVGDVTRYGLPRPDHRVLETHPIMNTQLLHHLAHGDVVPRPDVAELRGDTVRFVDGAEEQVDTIIYATGYRASLPCLGALQDDVLRPGALRLNMFPRGHPALFVVGHFETDGAAYPVVSRQGALVARLLGSTRAGGSDRVRATRDLEAHIERLVRASTRDLRGGVRHVPTERHAFYVQFDIYVRALDRLLRRLERRRS
ncbi:MAG TPA: NAD(P)-binding domain-containing protein [Gemmatimonadaceae bacterium]|nr:NAD(P)-binding domain-containing protein [Gemmatimonadaceae bacterium]